MAMTREEDFGLSCSCGSENFERVVVRRVQQADYVTDFVACVHCRVMFHLPVRSIMSDPEFRNDAAYASGAYRKRGRGRS